MNSNEYRIASEAYLRQSVSVLRERIRVRLGGEKSAETNGASLEIAERALDEMRQQASGPFALDEVAAVFELTPFERDVLLLCAGVEIDSDMASLCGQLHEDSRLRYCTAELVRHVLHDTQWPAFSGTGRLRRGCLIELGPGVNLATRPITIRERILEALLGNDELDVHLGALMSRQTVPNIIAPSHRAVAANIAELWSGANVSEWPAVLLSGEDRLVKRGIAATAAKTLGLTLYALTADEISGDVLGRDKLLRYWECETKLSPCALYIDGDEFDAPNALRNASSFAERLTGPLVLSGKFPTLWQRRCVRRFEVPTLGLSEQRHMWQNALGPATEALSDQIDGLVGTFQLNAGTIQLIAQGATKHLEITGVVGLGTQIWDACRAVARPRLDDLVQRIESKASLDDLVLPIEEKQTLQDIMAQARQRVRVLEQGGFGAKGMRGLGLGVMFAGVSGTGKTMAAGILANELGLDLYRVDLSRVVNKYIGETEKNLARIFDAADEGGVVLLFDEADALFGKRSDVNDSHDRHANIEVSYLLQRMETYQGVAILTTNMKGAVDTAFLRRLRYVVTFPFPDIAQRMELWQRAFPGQTLVEGLDWYKLARLNVTGGNIRTMALNAASLAADVGEPVRMAHVRRAAYAECMKLDKSPLLGEILAWE